MMEFVLGFETTARLLLLIAGGAAAVILFAAAVLLVACAAGAVFDAVTASLAKRWQRSGRKPRNRLERIILDSRRPPEA